MSPKIRGQSKKLPGHMPGKIDAWLRHCSSLPEPELYVIVNGKPTKAGVLWRTLVYVDSLKQAIQELKKINWLYKNVAVHSIDEATRKVIEIYLTMLRTQCWKKLPQMTLLGFSIIPSEI